MVNDKVLKTNRVYVYVAETVNDVREPSARFLIEFGSIKSREESYLDNN